MQNHQSRSNQMPRSQSRAALSLGNTYHVIEEVRDEELACLLAKQLEAGDAFSEKGHGPVFSDRPKPSRHDPDRSLAMVDSLEFGVCETRFAKAEPQRMPAEKRHMLRYREICPAAPGKNGAGRAGISRAQKQPAGRFQDSTSLAEESHWIRKMLHDVEAAHDVERLVCKPRRSHFALVDADVPALSSSLG